MSGRKSEIGVLAIVLFILAVIGISLFLVAIEQQEEERNLCSVELYTCFATEQAKMQYETWHNLTKEVSDE